MAIDNQEPKRTYKIRGTWDELLSECTLRTAVSASNSYSKVARWYGLTPSTRTRAQITRRISELGVDVSHFKRSGHNKGLLSISLDEFIEELDKPGKRTGWVKHYLIAFGLKEYRCEGVDGALCGLSSWQGYVLSLELDHIDGDNENNKMSNLRLLCPNCHTLTPTWRGRNKKVKRV